MDLFDLTDHVAIVTGGNRGIGLGMATGLVQAGASVAIWSRDESRNADAVRALESAGGRAAGFACDVADEASVAAALAGTVDHFGRVDSLFANAGVSAYTSFPETPLDEWRHILDVNLTGVFLTARAVAARLIEQGEGGSMAFTASLAARFGIPQAPHYTATKGGVLQLARSLAVRLARYRIRVNVVSPGWIDTEMTEAVKSNERMDQAAIARTPLRRWGTGDDFRGTAVFLASQASAFMTGAELVVDGGFSAS